MNSATATTIVTSSTQASGTVTRATFLTPEHLCPDLLRHSQLGAADGWRGRMVRGVFLVLKLWPPRR
jgi:hypothetical protein